MKIFLLENGNDKFVGYTSDMVRRRHFIKQKVFNSDDQKLIYKTIREKDLPWKEWVMTIIEEFPCSDINDVIRRKRELILLKCANLNNDETRFNPALYKKEWYKNKISAIKRKEKCNYASEEN